MMTREELARMVLEVLAKQKKYFRIRHDDPGKRAALEESKAAEAELKRECERIGEGMPLFPEDVP